ncbi:MAG: hypothetical protein U0Q16_31240 [Bryobacteraceae bacterium]
MLTARSLVSPIALLAFAASGTLFAQTTITASPAALTFFYQVGRPTPAAQSVRVTATNNAPVTVGFSTTSGGSWLFVAGSPGTTPFDVAASVSPNGLAPGTYSGSITLTSTGATTVTVPVNFTISNTPLMTPSPSALTFTYALNGTAPPAQTIQLTTTSDTPIGFSAAATTQNGGNWLSVTPLNGNTPNTLTVSVATAGLAAGTYNGAVAISAAAAGNSPLQIPVTFRVLEEARITLSPSALTFDYQVGGPLPTERPVSVTSTGGPVNFSVAGTAANNLTWLSVTPTAGTTPQNFTVLVNPGSLAPGVYQGTITVTAPGVTNSPQTMAVTLRITNDPVLTASPASLTFTHQAGGVAPPRQLVLVTNFGNPVSLGVATNGGSWLSATPSAGSTPLGILVSANPTGLAPGVYNGNVVVAGSAANSPLTIPVTLVVSSTSVLRVSENVLNFYAQVGGANPASRAITVSATAPPQAFTASASALNGSWLSVTPGTANAPADVTVGVNIQGLTAGLYTGSITISGPDSGATPLVIPVRLTLSNSPVLVAPTSPLVFNFSAAGQQPPNQAVAVTSSGTAISFTATSTTTTGTNWLVVAPNGAVATPTNLTVGVNTFGLGEGFYTGVLTLTAPGVANSPVFVPVLLNVSTASELVVPPSPLSFLQTVGQPAPSPQALRVTSSGTILSFTVTTQTLSGGNWLKVTPSSGVTPSDLAVTADGTGLDPGTYGGTIRLDSGASSRTIPVTLEVRRQLPSLNLSQASLTFNLIAGGGAPATQQVQITSSGDAIPFAVTSSITGGGNWLSVSGTGTTTPATLTIGINPAGLTPGTYNATINITSTAAGNSPRSIPVTLTVVAGASPTITSVQHAASFQPTAAVPGLIVTLRGTGIGPTTEALLKLTPQGNVDTTLSAVRVLFDNIAAPLLYVSATQINCVVPYALAGRPQTSVQVEFQGVLSNRISLNVADANPGIFVLNQAGQGAIVNYLTATQTSINGANTPAPRGGVVAIYATGEGATSPAGADGSVPGANAPLKQPLLPVRVRIGTRDAQVVYAGSAPSAVSGLLQVNVIIPDDAPVGAAVPITLSVGTFNSPPGVTIAIR